MKHSPKNWAIVGWIQLGIIIWSFTLPNHIINSATWYATILDFGRIALLFGVPVGDIFLVLKLLAIAKRNKKYLKQFIDVHSQIEYESIDLIYFINLTPKQIDSTRLAFEHSRNELTFNPSFPFELLQRYLQGTNKNV
jgi:diketogulonate reductase-like aldo/keto reductase